MPRAEFSRKTKAQAFVRCGGHCEECGVKLSPGKFEYDHEFPGSEGGPATLENCVVRCTACHSVKTAKRDVPLISKIRRVRDKHTAAARKRSKFATSRDGKFKQKISGEIVPR